MNIEIPGGLLIVMTILNALLLFVIVAGFLNLKRVFHKLKSRVVKIRVE